MLGICYHNGDGVAQNNQEAVKWCRQAAENGLAVAQYNMGFFCEHGVGGASKENALEWYQKAANQGYEDAKKAVKRMESGGMGSAAAAAAALAGVGLVWTFLKK